MRGKKRIDVVVLGGINTDFLIRGRHLPQPGQTVQGDSFYQGPGGKGANQAVAAARLGAKVAMIGRVGQDERGRSAIGALRKEGVQTRHVTRDPRHPTGAAIIAVNAEGEKQITAALGANSSLRVSHIHAAEELIASARVLLMQFESPMSCVLLAAKLANKHQTQVVLDPAPAQETPASLFPLLTAIRPNADEARQLTGIKICNQQTARRAASILKERGIRWVAVEAGNDGDLLLGEEEWLFPRLKVNAVDATGAGDAFAAAMAVGLAEDLPFRQIGELANATAALATTRIGAQEALPRRKEVERLVKQRRSRR